MFKAILLIIVVWLSPILSYADQPFAQDTTSRHTFAFTDDTFYVDEDATNAVVTVAFTPGDRSWTGWVNYSVSNGTATADADYTTVGGTLYFSGNGTPGPLITIPINHDASVEGDETVRLFLWNTNAIITRSNATLVIRDKAPKPHLIISGGNGAISLSWPSDFPDHVLEKSTQIINPDWVAVSAPCFLSNGFWHVFDSFSGVPSFYRLKKTTSP